MAHHTVLIHFKFMQEVLQIQQLGQDKLLYINPQHLFFKILNTLPNYLTYKK